AAPRPSRHRPGPSTPDAASCPVSRTRQSRSPRRLAGLVTASAMAVAPLALAGPATAIEPGVGAVPGMAEPLVETIPTEPPAPAELPSSTSSEYFDTPRDLAGCPFRTTPPAPVDESEVPLPGMTAPSPPPAPEAAAGGSALDGCDEAVPEGFEVPQDVTASAWLISDLDTGEVVAARDAHGRYRPASVIKTLLASVVLD